MRTTLTVLLGFTLLLGGGALALPVQAEVTSMGDAINKAGRQRMLTQRMVKAYCLIGIDVDPFKADDQRRKAIALFDTQLAELQAYAATEEERRALDHVVQLWGPFKAVVSGPVIRERAVTLHEGNDELLRAAHKVVLLLQERSGTSYGRLVNIAGRQRMLGQRLAKLYMLRVWGIGGVEVLDETERAKNEFKGAMQELIDAPENTPQLNEALEQARKQWTLYKHGLERADGDYIPLIVTMTGEQLLTSMNNITALYTALSER